MIITYFLLYFNQELSFQYTKYSQSYIYAYRYLLYTAFIPTLTCRAHLPRRFSNVVALTEPILNALPAQYTPARTGTIPESLTRSENFARPLPNKKQEVMF